MNRCIGKIDIGKLSLWLYNYQQFGLSKSNIAVDLDFAWFGVSWMFGRISA